MSAAAEPAAAPGGVRYMIAALDLATGQILYRIRVSGRETGVPGPMTRSRLPDEALASSTSVNVRQRPLAFAVRLLPPYSSRFQVLISSNISLL